MQNSGDNNQVAVALVIYLSGKGIIGGKTCKTCWVNNLRPRVQYISLRVQFVFCLRPHSSLFVPVRYVGMLYMLSSRIQIKFSLIPTTERSLLNNYQDIAMQI